MWDLPGPGIEPMTPALAGRLLTTVPPGKSLHKLFYYLSVFPRCFFSFLLCLGYSLFSYIFHIYYQLLFCPFHILTFPSLILLLLFISLPHYLILDTFHFSSASFNILRLHFESKNMWEISKQFHLFLFLFF